MADLVEVTRFIDPEEAYVANSFLNSRGIKTIIQNEHHLTTAPHLRIGLGGYRILCGSSDREAARNALNACRANEPSETREGSDDTKDNFSPRKRNWLWLPLAASFFPPFIPRYRSGWEQYLQIGFMLILLALLMVYIGGATGIIR